MSIETIHHLPSGTELSVEAAIGDLSRVSEALDRRLGHPAGVTLPDVEGLKSDLSHVVELLEMLDRLAERFDRLMRNPSGYEYEGLHDDCPIDAPHDHP